MLTTNATAPPAKHQPIPAARASGVYRHYLGRHGLYPPRIATAPSSALGLVVVIPCHDEPDLLTTLRALKACVRPACAAEVIVVINASEDAPAAVQARNRETLAQAQAWTARHADPRLGFHLLHFPDLPRRHAGVGLARKLGMDEAVARFLAAGAADGAIASLDADCSCDEGYLCAIEGFFSGHPAAAACTVYFEHPVDEVPDGGLRSAAIDYELFLRYYRHGLRYAGFPHAHYTLGSALAVRAQAYARHGGMNRRQAGEDFYFVQKLAAAGEVGEVVDTRVVPAARISDRTPFGTGRALARGVSEDRRVYAPAVFRDLRALISRVEADGLSSDDSEALLTPLPSHVAAFLLSQGFDARVREIRANTASRGTRLHRFYRWLNALRCLQLIHYATEHVYTKVPIADAARTLLQWQGIPTSTADQRALLDCYRTLDQTRSPRLPSTATSQEPLTPPAAQINSTAHV